MSIPVHQQPIRVEVDPEALSAVTFALQRTIDDLEARALVAASHDPDLGPSSAAEYRADIDRLAGLLGQLGHPASRPDPARAAVRWFDGTYTIDEQHRPVPMRASHRLDQLLEAAVAARVDGRLTPGAIVEVLAEATGTPAAEIADRLVEVRRNERDLDHEPDRSLGRQLSRELSGPNRSTR